MDEDNQKKYAASLEIYFFAFDLDDADERFEELSDILSDQGFQVDYVTVEEAVYEQE